MSSPVAGGLAGKRPLALEPDGDGTRPGSRRGKPPAKGRVLALNGFARTVQRTVEVLRGDTQSTGYEDVRRILANIRKQYDDVHCEADRREAELMHVRREIRFLEADAAPPEMGAYASVGIVELQQRLEEMARELHAACETRQVYTHMINRLKCETTIVKQKAQMMENHLRRKSHEVEQRQRLGRRVHQEKIESINRLEEMEQELDVERQVCASALNDLDESVRQKRSEVNHREEFERWRYEVALDAANEAFQATAGRYRKIYAVEKLTGNCLQKITFEQAEQSQATEDGFQKIREVTGLTDVMDIVHKFLNRETEHEQLRLAVREAEVRLQSLREAEAARNGEGVPADPQGSHLKSKGLTREVAAQEHEIDKANRDLEGFQRRLRQSTLLFESIVQWGKRMARSLQSVEELPTLGSQEEIVPFFGKLSEVVDRFLTKAQQEVPAPKLTKLTGQASAKEHTEQLKLLTDKEFMRLNLRVPATLDQRAPEEAKKRGAAANEEEQQEVEHASERDRMKAESWNRAGGLIPLRSMGLDYESMVQAPREKDGGDKARPEGDKGHAGEEASKAAGAGNHQAGESAHQRSSQLAMTQGSSLPAVEAPPAGKAEAGKAGAARAMSARGPRKPPDRQVPARLPSAKKGAAAK